jgi:Na+:H+ antiporter, NhaA family
MTLFFGIAAVEITQSCLPGGDLHPLKRAVHPLFATAGGVLGLVALYLLLNTIFGTPALVRGWGIPTVFRRRRVMSYCPIFWSGEP